MELAVNISAYLFEISISIISIYDRQIIPYRDRSIHSNYIAFLDKQLSCLVT